MYDLGKNVQNVLEHENKNYHSVVYQMGKPILESEFNLTGLISNENLRKSVKYTSHSGWLTYKDTPINCKENSQGTLCFDKSNSNRLLFGDTISQFNESKSEIAIVNGWIVPVASTNSITKNPGNFIDLPQPPKTGSRLDLVIVEFWLKLLDPISGNGLHKIVENSFGIYPYGNVSWGPKSSIPASDIFSGYAERETTKRIQLQYKIRTIENVSVPENSFKEFDNYIEHNKISVSEYIYTHQLNNLNDPGLWRAGDGSTESKQALDTVDGFMYALPLCVVNRFNSGHYDPISNPLGGKGLRPELVNKFYGLDSYILDLRMSVKKEYSNTGEKTLQNILKNSLGTTWTKNELGVYGVSNLELDSISKTNIENVNVFAAPDGFRRSWKNNQNSQMYCVVVTKKFPVENKFISWDGKSKLGITALGKMHIQSDSGLHWIVTKDIEKYCCVVSATVNSNENTVNIDLNTADQDYLENDTLCVFFYIEYPDAEFNFDAFKNIHEVRDLNTNIPCAFTYDKIRQGDYISPNNFNKGEISDDKIVYDYGVYNFGKHSENLFLDKIPRQNRSNRQIKLKIESVSNNSITLPRIIKSGYKYMSCMSVLDMDNNLIGIASQTRNSETLTIELNSTPNSDVFLILNTDAVGIDFGSGSGIEETLKYITSPIDCEKNNFYHVYTVNSSIYPGAYFMADFPAYWDGIKIVPFVWVNGTSVPVINKTYRGSTGAIKFEFDNYFIVTSGDIVEADNVIYAPLFPHENIGIFHTSYFNNGVSLDKYLENQNVQEIIDPLVLQNSRVKRLKNIEETFSLENIKIDQNINILKNEIGFYSENYTSTGSEQAVYGFLGKTKNKESFLTVFYSKSFEGILDSKNSVVKSYRPKGRPII